jgi:hypothetical protein
MTRRALIGGAAGASLGLFVPAMSGAAQTTPVPGQTCGEDEGVKLLWTWFHDGLPALGLSMNDLLPPLDWVPFLHPRGMLLRYPPNWTAEALWAEGLLPSGRPAWTTEMPALAPLSATRLTSPDRTAAFEFGSGNVLGYLLTPTEAGLIAAESLLGDNPYAAQLCIDTPAPVPPMPDSWFQAVAAATPLRQLDPSASTSAQEPSNTPRSIVVTQGTVIHLPSYAEGFPPATTLTYSAMGGPIEQFADLTRRVYIPILFQFLGGGSSGEPGDDDDDEEDDDE